MKIKNAFRSFARKLMYAPGWRTTRKIVVIESDDWGSVSIPTRKAYDTMRSAGITVDQDPYCKYDGLATPYDLRLLFDVLTSFRDKNGRHPVFTANAVVANPDFPKIKASNFEAYHYQTLPETLNSFQRTSSSFDLWKEGIEKHIFHPQFHGREHLQIFHWLSALQEGKNEVQKAFDLGAFAIPVTNHSGMKRPDYRAAFDCNTREELEDIKRIVKDGQDLFEDLFGYRSSSVIAPCYTWHKELESSYQNNEILLIQGIAFQKEPVWGKNFYKKRYNYLGKTNRGGQYYSVRNVFFEPSLYSDGDLVNTTLKRMNDAFDLHKPAIIGSHRLNYIGAMVPENRDRNLRLLSQLLNRIMETWSDVEFISTAELAGLIAIDKTS